MQPARLAELALKYRLPTMFGARENVEAGGLMSYGADRNDLVRLARLYIDKILKGAKPAELPVEQAYGFEPAAFEYFTQCSIGSVTDRVNAPHS
jgi:ABC-type uncharacterized transport system substrate-binding protein